MKNTFSEAWKSPFLNPRRIKLSPTSLTAGNCWARLTILPFYICWYSRHQSYSLSKLSLTCFGWFDMREVVFNCTFIKNSKQFILISCRWSYELFLKYLPSSSGHTIDKPERHHYIRTSLHRCSILGHLITLFRFPINNFPNFSFGQNWARYYWRVSR